MTSQEQLVKRAMEIRAKSGKSWSDAWDIALGEHLDQIHAANVALYERVSELEGRVENLEKDLN